MKNILLVEDMEDVRAGLQRILERLGHQVTPAEDGRGALEAMRRARCDLIITDINMPRMDGIELIISIRNEWPDVPVIAISGGGLLPKDLLLDNAGVLGAVKTLPKPIGLAEIKEAVESALGTSASGSSSDR